MERARMFGKQQQPARVPAVDAMHLTELPALLLRSKARRAWFAWDSL